VETAGFVLDAESEAPGPTSAVSSIPNMTCTPS
jgi:hypothetical protein